MAFLGDFGKFFGLGSSEEVLGDVGEFVAGKPGRFVGEAAARATDNLAGDGGISPASTADQALEQSAVSVSKRGDVPQELSTMTGTRGMTTQAGFGALAPLFGTASRFLGSKSGQIVTGVGTAVGLGGASFMGSE